MVCGCKEKNKKTAVNNQWVGTSTSGKSNDYRDKTEFSNEWVSTNKTTGETDLIKHKNLTEKDR
jgi:hypothetical protein